MLEIADAPHPCARPHRGAELAKQLSTVVVALTRTKRRLREDCNRFARLQSRSCQDLNSALSLVPESHSAWALAHFPFEGDGQVHHKERSTRPSRDVSGPLTTVP